MVEVSGADGPPGSDLFARQNKAAERSMFASGFALGWTQTGCNLSSKQSIADSSCTAFNPVTSGEGANKKPPEGHGFGFLRCVAQNHQSHGNAPPLPIHFDCAARAALILRMDLIRTFPCLRLLQYFSLF